MKAFNKLGTEINNKSAYVVNFDTDELIDNSITAVNKDLWVSKIFFSDHEGAFWRKYNSTKHHL